MVYIVDRQTVIPSKQDEYEKIVVEKLVPEMEQLGAPCYGSFRAWRSNQYWNFWEIDGGMEKFIDIDAAYETGSLKGLQSDIRGLLTNYDSRALKPAKFSRSIAKLKEMGIKGGLYAYTNTPVDPARQIEWLKLFENIGLKLEGGTGLHTVGYFTGGIGTVMAKEFQFISQLVCVEDWSMRDTYGKAIASNPEVQRWWDIAFNYRGHHSATELIPLYLPY